MLRHQNRSLFLLHGRNRVMARASNFLRRTDPNPQQQVVICSRCGTAIVVDTSQKVPAEFSVACPKCARRDFYTDHALQPFNAELKPPQLASSFIPV
jgi:DNA-directed RNA polymerase subunit RPC12/RpoP